MSLTSIHQSFTVIFMYEFSSRVRYSEIGPDGRMTPVALMTRMQDCGVFHCDSVGRGPAYWKENRCGWIIVSWQVILLELPEFGNRVIARTIPYRFHGFEGDRNYEVYALPGGNPDEQPVRCAYANSRWVYYDLAKQRPIRVPPEEAECFPLDPPLPMECSPRKIALPDLVPEIKKPIEIMEMNIDTNQHVNNLQYIDMARAYLPADYRIGELRVEYSKQCRLGDVLYPKVYSTEKTVWVSLDAKDGSMCAAVQMIRR